MYDTMLMIHPSTPIGIRELRSALEDAYAKRRGKGPVPTLTVHGPVLRLAFPGLTFGIGYEDPPHVVEESAEIAERYGAGRADQAAIAQCAARFVVGADGSDDDMEYFNDFVTIVECAERAGRVFQFDPVSGQMMTPAPK